MVMRYTLPLPLCLALALAAPAEEKKPAEPKFTAEQLDFFEREGAGLMRAEGCDLLHSFSGIREDLTKLFYGNYFLELVNEMTAEREEGREVYELLLSFLSGLDEKEPEEEIVRVFEIRMLSLYGYRPHMKSCSLCKKDWDDLRNSPTVFFSFEKGVLVCEGCSKNSGPLIPLSLGTARLIERISQMEISKIHRFKFTVQALQESRALLPRFIMHQLGKQLKSLKMLQGASRGTGREAGG